MADYPRYAVRSKLGIWHDHEKLTEALEVCETVGGVVYEPLALTACERIAAEVEPDWNGISAQDRRLWFGAPVKGTEAPWLSGMGACLVKIWDIRRRPDGVIEYGIGNETEPPPDKIGWVTGDKFFDEWPD